ncbi:hypothetical protein CC80DRAFT_497365 [Byssothecium circinans]|uniref:Uncharacterized protein n=1 Tax=Byssothecium circinans TaxID=147558 RepID=A0A6A5TKW4_9PLEO|nr:hypothetical protein CC80DRAFT_497365 [Byssothecium circinans]
MNAARTPLRLRARSSQLASRQRAPLPQYMRRRYATNRESEPPAPHPPSSPPNPNSHPPKEPSRVGAFYRTFSYPILKAFLGALFTYQIVYYVWLKLEVVEEKHNKRNEIRDLRTELKDAVLEQRAKAKGAVEKVEGKVGEVKEEGKKKGWWPW